MNRYRSCSGNPPKTAASASTIFATSGTTRRASTSPLPHTTISCCTPCAVKEWAWCEETGPISNGLSASSS